MSAFSLQPAKSLGISRTSHPQATSSFTGVGSRKPGEQLGRPGLGRSVIAPAYAVVDRGGLTRVRGLRWYMAACRRRVPEPRQAGHTAHRLRGLPKPGLQELGAHILNGERRAPNISAHLIPTHQEPAHQEMSQRKVTGPPNTPQERLRKNGTVCCDPYHARP